MLAAMRRRIVLASLVVLCCSAFQARGFTGCGSGSGGGGMLPPGGPEGCFVDSDCLGDPCTSRACMAGRCVEVGILDLDFDGVSPPPCGLDCDDGNPGRYPDAFEICDGLDQDCDATVDEEATAEPVRWSLGRSPSALPSAIAVRALAGRRELLLTEVSDGAVLLRRVDPFGGELGGIEVPAAGIGEHDLVARADGAVTLLGLVPAEQKLVAVDIDGRSMVALAEVPLGGVASGLAAAAYPGGVAAVWAEDGGEVWLWTSALSAPVLLGPLPDTRPLGVAAFGSSIAVTVPPDAVLFVDPGLGEVTGRRSLEAPRTWAEGALAASAGPTFALSRDAFDLSIARLDPAAPLRFTPAPSVPFLGVPGRIDAFGERLLVTRMASTTSSGAQIGVLDTSLALQAAYDTTGFGPDVSSGWDVALDDELVAVLTSFPTQLDGVSLYCGSR
jgi:hypothetical protein